MRLVGVRIRVTIFLLILGVPTLSLVPFTLTCFWKVHGGDKKGFHTEIIPGK